MENQNLEQCVNASLRRVCGADAVRNVQCQVQSGVVTLSGTVSSREEMMMCVTVARTVPRVQTIDNQLSLGGSAEATGEADGHPDGSMAAE